MLDTCTLYSNWNHLLNTVFSIHFEIGLSGKFPARQWLNTVAAIYYAVPFSSHVYLVGYLMMATKTLSLCSMAGVGTAKSWRQIMRSSSLVSSWKNLF